MLIIKKITARETYLVRQAVLRKGKPIESCHFIGDDLESTVHFGIYLENEIAGIVSLFKNKNSAFGEENQFQIRGMAVLEDQQKNGFGQELLKHCEKFAVSQDVTVLWFNARINACGFYEKLNFNKTGNSFDIPDVGEHFLMFKKY